MVDFSFLMIALRTARALIGLRQDKLAEQAGVSRQTIKRIEALDKTVRVLEKVQAAVEARGALILPGTAGIASAVAVSEKNSDRLHPLRAARALLGLRQEELAKRAGLSRQTIARIERYDHFNPGYHINMPQEVRTALWEKGVDFIPRTENWRFAIGIQWHPRGRAQK